MLAGGGVEEGGEGMKTSIEDRLQASINMDAINGNSAEKSVVGRQIQEAIYKIKQQKAVLAERDKDIEDWKKYRDEVVRENIHLCTALAEQERAIAFLRESIRMSGLLNDENNKQIAHLKGLLAEVCKWTYDSDADYYDSGCGGAYCLIDGDLAENRYSHCPNCGKKIDTTQKEEEE
jgi:hypothetical protein